MLHFCSLTLVRTVQSALAQTTFSEQTGRHDGRERKEGLYMSLIFDILISNTGWEIRELLLICKCK